MIDAKRYVIHVTCDSCPEGYDVRYAAAPWVPWSTEKAARRSDSLNLRVLARGHFGGDAEFRQFAGPAWGASNPLAIVTEFEGRCYLTNGYHRAYALALRHATHIPCIYIQAADYGQIGAGPGFFDRALLESVNPPTVGHFTNGAATQVQLRNMKRVISILWSESVVPAE